MVVRSMTGCVELLGQGERLGDKVVALLTVTRLEHGDLGESSEATAVLLALRREHAGIVDANDDETRH